MDSDTTLVFLENNNVKITKKQVINKSEILFMVKRKCIVA